MQTPTTSATASATASATQSGTRQWSQYQLAVFENVATGTGHTVIKAVAGSGKTTTIVEALRHVALGLTVLFVAFNKAIADELAKRAPKHVDVSTLHSYGLKIITRALGRLRIDKNRMHRLIDDMRSETFETVIRIGKELGLGTDEEITEAADLSSLRFDLIKTVSLAKGSLAGEETQIDAIIDGFDIEFPKRSPFQGVILPEHAQTALRAAFVQDVLALLVRCADVSDGTLDFDDMIWLPVVLDLSQKQFDRVFVDETQDLNPCQIELTMRAVKSHGRIIAVGDPRQAIYRFRGADSQAVENVVKRLDAKILPLSVCYRCCRSVIEEAKRIVPEIEWAPGAEEGKVEDATMKEMVKGVRPGDFVLSRINAPLISLCMRFLKEGRPATIQGRDIGASLAAFVKKSAARDVEALRDYVEQWRDVECARLSKKRVDTQATEDRAECILALSDGATSVADVISRIENLFADTDDSKRIVLSSTHKAKGMERDTVWMLVGTYGRRPGIEEQNLIYVAQTRARKALYLVHGDTGEANR